MKSPLILAVILFAGAIPGRDFSVHIGTNAIPVQFENTIMDDSLREFMVEDWQRMLVPAISYVELRTIPGAEYPTIVNVDRFWSPRNDSIRLRIPDFLEPEGTNFVLHYRQGIISAYENVLALVTAWSNAVAQADAFVQTTLSSNSLAALSDHDILGLYLSKRCPPGENPIPAARVAFYRSGIEGGTYFPPPRYGFQVLPYGPTGATNYLWCVVPWRKNGKVHSVNMIYYDDKWWLSDWMLESGEQTW